MSYTDYTHYKYIIRDKKTDEITKTIIAKNKSEASLKINSNEKVAECIGGINKNYQ